MRKSVIAAAALTVALTGAGAVGVAVNAQSAAHPSGVHSQQIAKAKLLTISSFTFSPGTLKVRAGQKIKVTNNDAFDHTVTSDDGTSFNVTVPGKSSVTFKAPATPGQYAYHCSIHPTMHGTLKVK
jgi:plastocyanin